MTGALVFPVVAALLAQIRPILPADPWNAPPAAECETIEDLNPSGPLFDMVDWTTLDADLRATSHLASEPASAPGAFVQGTVVKADRITYFKTLNGDTWDVNVVDDVGIWAWRTETNWNTPRSFTQFRRVGQVLTAPRVARGGYPGTRWTNCDSAYAAHVACGMPTSYGHLGYIIHELYGPYDYDAGFGDMGRVPVLKIAYYYGCTTPSTDSCPTVEVSWMSQRFGMFSWRLYQRTLGEPWRQTGGGPVDVYLVPGVIRETFPCDEEMP